ALAHAAQSSPRQRPSCSSTSPTAVRPLRHGDRRAPADLRVDVEPVHEPAGAGETDAEAPGGGVAVSQRLLDVGDPGAIVAGDDDDPPAAVGLLGPQHHLTLVGVDDD